MNYDMHEAFGGTSLFASNFNPKKLRLLSGDLGQQLEVTECMLKLAIHFATFFKVYSFAYEGMGNGLRAKVFKDLVAKPTPRMVEQSEFRELMFR